MLRHKNDSAAATLLTLTRSLAENPPTYEVAASRKDMAEERSLVWANSGTALDEYAPPLNWKTWDPDSLESVRRRLGLLQWRDWEAIAEW
jgi:hypothetical protein